MGRTYWLCSRNRYGKCKARIITMNHTREVIIKNQDHNHQQERHSEIDAMDVISFDTVMEIINDWDKKNDKELIQ